ncbi:MAG: methionyl-tRNA formyltransferase [Alphaproteobacteria bacterium]|nr:methionyl-tRNA formyltransferase [Alphaproteobacteria bacterium]
MGTPLRLAFMGTPDFAVPSLLALLDAGHEIAAVYTQPPRPAGRGQRETKSPVHQAAEAKGLDVRTPRTLKDEAAQAAFAALGLDIAIVVAYGQILPKPILEAPRLGCLNVHASLLPRWRGAAPIQRALLAGDTETGVMVMAMEEGLDTGPVYAAATLAIPPNATGGWLHDELSARGARLLAETLPAIAVGDLVARPQGSEGVTYAKKITADDLRLDWRETAEEAERRVRAFAPAPGAWFPLGEERIKVLEAEIIAASGTPGEALDDRLTIACAAGALRLLRVQRAGKAAMSAAEFLRGRAVPAGTRLGA